MNESPIFTLAIDTLNSYKAWYDSHENSVVPDHLRMMTDAVLMAYEVRKNGTYAEQVERAQMAGVIHVCPDKDIVCGSRPENWCDTCPLHKEIRR